MGTRLIPDGTLRGVHFVQTPGYVQVTGVGDLTKLNIPRGDAGGYVFANLSIPLVAKSGLLGSLTPMVLMETVCLISDPMNIRFTETPIGNPIGGIVFSSAFTGQIEQLHEWTVGSCYFLHGDCRLNCHPQNFMSATQFCFRGCRDGPNAAALCQHIYDEMGCEWNMPASYDAGVFEQCAGDTGEVA